MAADFFSRFGDVWVTGKVDVVEELFPADVQYHLPPFPDMDREALTGFIAAIHQAFPDFSLTIHEELSDGGATAYRWSCTGTFTGESPLLPVAPTGRATSAMGSTSSTGRTGSRLRCGTTGTGWAGCSSAGSSRR